MNCLILKTFLLALVVSISAAPESQQRIVGGSLTTINNYPFASSLLYSRDLVNYRQNCAGAIITQRTILTCASCVYRDPRNRWRVRVGSTYANSGGSVHRISSILIHPSYNSIILDNDVALLKTSTQIYYVNGAVQPASIAGSSYNVPDNQAVWTMGWGATAYGGAYSEQLRHVQIWTINKSTCRQRYNDLRLSITDNMMCSGWLDQGGRSPCTGDNGSPLIHNNVIVGVHSWQEYCATPRYPAVSTRVSRVSPWIIANASSSLSFPFPIYLGSSLLTLLYIFFIVPNC